LLKLKPSSGGSHYYGKFGPNALKNDATQ